MGATQVANSSPEISGQVSHMPSISPARAANVDTHAWTKQFPAFECRSDVMRILLGGSNIARVFCVGVPKTGEAKFPMIPGPQCKEAPKQCHIPV